MDFDRIKQNLRFRSGRSSNMSKRFPTHELPKSTEEAEYQRPARPAFTQVEGQQPKPHAQSRPPPKRKVKHTKKPATEPSIPKDNVQPPVRSEAPLPTPQLAAPDDEVRQLQQYQSHSPAQATSPPDPLSRSSSAENYDLESVDLSTPPIAHSLESLTELLYSSGYLDTLVGDPQLLRQFTTFLSRYQPTLAPLVPQYLNTQKVVKAVAYANAVATSTTLKDSSGESGGSDAAVLSDTFTTSSEEVYKNLLTTALPAWITYSIVKTSTICLTAEITGQHSSPFTRDLIGGLSEVFCLTDPNKPDNPIIYASSYFYTLTGYSKDQVIGHNCRFLQGNKTQSETVSRLREAIKNGDEICETLLNYTGKGKPFVNVLLLAPLHDSKRNLKYYLGAQVDASRLVESRKGIDGFERFITRRDLEAKSTGDRAHSQQNALEKLRDLSLSFDLDENAIVQNTSRRNSLSVEPDMAFTPRRRIREDENSDDENDSDARPDDDEWKLSAGSSFGRLPGIYQNYILMRPYPSLRMIFVSKGARKFGKLQQHPFLAHVAAPPSTISGLKESFQSSTPVTAKIALMADAGEARDGCVTGNWGRTGEDPAEKGETCWVSATPLHDAKNKVGVWMVIIVDKKSAASNLSQVSSLTKRTENSVTKTEVFARENEEAEPEHPLNSTLVNVTDDEILNSPTISPPTNEATEKMQISNFIPEEEKSQRSDKAGKEDLKNANEISGESQNGSTSTDPPTYEEQVQINPVAPPESTTDLASDVTPRQGSVWARDVGLRAMDYLTSQAAVNKVHEKDVLQEGPENQYWNLASPYSVD